MSSDQHTLLEAMEQQTISIAKGGILGSLSARCSIVACANPASGHYNRQRSIIDNMRISNAILSRFDLIFLMLDDPDLNRDKLLSEHVMRMHQKGNKKRGAPGDPSQDMYMSKAYEELGSMASKKRRMDSESDDI